MAKPNPTHRPEMLRQLHYTEMVKLLVRGWTKTEIAAKFGVSFTVIHNDFKKVMKELAESRLKDASQLRAFKMEEYSELKKEAWMAWERSKEDSERVTIEESDGMDGEGRQRKTTTVEGRLPDSQYLRIIATCLEAERELDGLNAPTKVDQVIRVDWDVFAKGAATRPHLDTIEAQIKAVAFDNSGLPLGKPAPRADHPMVPSEVTPTQEDDSDTPPLSPHLTAGLEEEEEKTFAGFSSSMLGEAHPEVEEKVEQEAEEVFAFLDQVVSTVPNAEDEVVSEPEEEPELVKPPPRPRAKAKPAPEPKPTPKPRKPPPKDFRGSGKSSKEKRR